MGDFARACRMIDLLVEAGATHVTIQTVTKPEEMTRDEGAIKFLTKNIMILSDNLKVIAYAKHKGLSIGATVVEHDSIDTLVNSGVSFFKVLSGDITYEKLHQTVALTGLPFYLSTAVSTPEEIAHALDAARASQPEVDVRLIHTVMPVPTPANLLNLSRINYLQKRFAVPVAYGQHSDVRSAMSAAIVAGAESVFVYVAEELSPSLPDAPHAISCIEAKELLAEISQSKEMIGVEVPPLTPGEEKLQKIIRRTVVANKEIRQGERFTLENISYKKPLTGLSPSELPAILSSSADRDYKINEDIQYPSND